MTDNYSLTQKYVLLSDPFIGIWPELLFTHRKAIQRDVQLTAVPAYSGEAGDYILL